MFFRFPLVALALPALVAAQDYGGPPAGGASTTAAPAAAPSAPVDTTGHMNIDVAFNQTFTFHPNNIQASAGTLVTFWVPNNGLTHSITQSSFGDPCTHLAASGNSSAGFDSGLIQATQFTINITDANTPIWFHCKQIGHCGMGMVGSINAPSTGNTFDNFMSAALKVGGNEVTETDAGFVSGGVGAVATGAPGSVSGSVKVVASAGASILAAAAIAFLV